MRHNMKKRVVVALGGNALGNSLPEQKIAVKSTAKTIIDLVEADCDVVVTHQQCDGCIDTRSRRTT